jgi:hypothetical protein
MKLLSLTLFIGSLFAADKPADPPAPPPTVEQLQQQVKDKDAQITQLQQQIVQLQGQGSATSKLFQACYQSLVQGETEKVQAAQKK